MKKLTLETVSSEKRSQEQNLRKYEYLSSMWKKRGQRVGSRDMSGKSGRDEVRGEIIRKFQKFGYGQ